MKTAIAAVVLFCVGGLGTAESYAQCIGSRCSIGLPVAVSTGATQLVISPGAPSLRVRQGLLGRTIIRQTRARPSVQIVTAPAVSTVSSVSFLQQPQFVGLQSFGTLASYGSYGGYMSDDMALAARIRQEAGEQAEIKSAVSELLGRLNEPVTAP